MTISHERIGEYMRIAMQVIADAGGELSSREVVAEVGRRIDLNEYERARYARSGYVRWESVLHFYSINMKHAGWIRKRAGVWVLTDAGREAMALAPLSIFDRGREEYHKYERARNAAREPMVDEADGPVSRQASFEQAQTTAREEIAAYVANLDGYELQDLIAALLRGMGYFTPHIATAGADGGIDIIAYKDPFGTSPPRLKVQVKHRQQRVDAPEVREFTALLYEDEVGLFVSSSGFTADARRTIQTAQKHIEHVDFYRFLELWEEYYEKLDEDDKQLLPIKHVAFLVPQD